jgi:hypothetical protein
MDSSPRITRHLDAQKPRRVVRHPERNLNDSETLPGTDCLAERALTEESDSDLSGVTGWTLHHSAPLGIGLDEHTC